jgi:hypothetical protein
MAVTELELPFDQVAVIDDSDRDAETLCYQLMALGVEPVKVAIEDRDLDEIVDEVRARAQAAVCDHYLGHKRVDFTGAEAVARLTAASIPSCLITMYAVDGDVEIRRYRGSIPSLLLRSDADEPELVAALLRSVEELRSGPARDRVPYRTSLIIERVSDEAGQPVADALVSGWHPDEPVRFPTDLLPPDVRGTDPSQLEGMILFAEVNLGAERSLDLFFRNFELAPLSTLGEALVRAAPDLDWGAVNEE